MATFDWSRFTVRINVKAPAEKLYWCWATKQGIEFWFLRRSDYKKSDGSLYSRDESVKKGGSYSWWWHGYPDEVVEHGEILEANGKDLFKFKFGGAGNCTVRIYKEQDEHIVELFQDEIPTDEKSKENWHIGCKTGWTFYMANMKSMLEGGVDLRNKNEQLQNMLNA
jgi:uncharacterized protein YndB with AHSA1/START domain